MTTPTPTNKKTDKTPTPRKRRKPVVVDGEVAAPPVTTLQPAADKPNWWLRITWVLLAFVFWLYLNASVLKKNPEPDLPPDLPPEPTPAVSLYADIAPLFPDGTEDQAMRYAAWFEAVAVKAQRDGKPVNDKTRTAVRAQYGLDDEALAALIAAKMAPFKDIGDAPWTETQLIAFCELFHEASEACLAASAD